MNIKSISFRDLIPFTEIQNKCCKSSLDLKKYLIAGIRKKIHFYAVNQSRKYVHMIKWGYMDIERPPYEIRFHDEEKEFFVLKGNMLPLSAIHHFDKLFKGTLNEIELFENIEGFHELVEYQTRLDFFNEYAESNLLSPPTEFKDIEYKHIFIEAKNIEVLDKLVKTQSSPKANKQTQRENMFINWLQDKDELVVSEMKKDDVWDELRKLDPHLFSAEPKTFFRVQKIITFKSGRKSL